MSADSNPHRILHIVTRAGDTLAESLINEQQRAGNVEIRIVDFTRISQPDYAEILDEIFAADSVHVW